MVDDRLILRGADGYDEARFAHLFNARRPERNPAVVLVAESEDDVVERVRLARARGWKVAIRAGGHSFPDCSLRDDGLVIDFGAFKETAFDEVTGIVSVTPSVSGGELNAHLSRHGRFFTTGDCPSLGLGGFLLQGGDLSFPKAIRKRDCSCPSTLESVAVPTCLIFMRPLGTVTNLVRQFVRNRSYDGGRDSSRAPHLDSGAKSSAASEALGGSGVLTSLSATSTRDRRLRDGASPPRPRDGALRG
jgi:hypothetical protein